MATVLWGLILIPILLILGKISKKRLERKTFKPKGSRSIFDDIAQRVAQFQHFVGFGDKRRKPMFLKF